MNKEERALEHLKETRDLTGQGIPAPDAGLHAALAELDKKDEEVAD